MQVYFDFLRDNLSLVTVYGNTQIEINRVYTFLNSAIKYEDKQATYTEKYKNGYKKEYVNFYDKDERTVPIGLIARVCSLLKGRFPGIQIGLSPRIDSMFRPKVALSKQDIINYAETLNIHDRKEGFKLTLHDHQVELIYQAMLHRRGSFKACTASGKSLAVYVMARYMTEVEHKKIAVVVPNSGLVVQLMQNFHDDYSWDEAPDNCTLIYGDSKDKLTAAQKRKLAELKLGEEVMLKPIVITTWQSLQNKEPSFFKRFDAVIVDECQGCRGPVLRQILDYCTSAENFKIGVSGTIPDDGLDAGYIESSLGKKYEIVSLWQLSEKGIITPVKVVALYVPYPLDCRTTICYSKFDEEYSIVTGNRSRFDILDMLINNKKITTEQNTVILFRNIDPLERVASYLQEHHPEFKYSIIKGEVKALERDRIRLEMDSSYGHILLGTYGCLQAGMNVKKLNNLVFGDPGKSMYMIMQSIGRIVRKCPGKEIATCYDIVDDASYMVHGRTRGDYINENCMVRHFRERVKYYDADKIPVQTVDLTGIVEADVKLDDIKQKRKEKAEKRAKQLEKRKKKAAEGLLKNYRRQF